MTNSQAYRLEKSRVILTPSVRVVIQVDVKKI